MNKYKALLLLVSSVSIAATNNIEYKFSTGVDFDSKFAPRYAEGTLPFKAVDYKSTGYNLTLADFSVNFKDYGLKLGTTWKSSRNNIKLNDELNDAKKPFAERDYNHDIQGKVYLDFDKKVKGLDMKAATAYYAPNLFAKDTLNEYVDGDKKYKDNDFLASYSVKGKIDKVDLDLSTEYRANKLVDYTVGTAYFKTNNKVDYEVLDNLKLSASYNANIDLDQMYKKYKASADEPDYEPTFLTNRYVTKFKHDGSFGLTYMDEVAKDIKDEYGLDFKARHTLFLVGHDAKDNIKSKVHYVEPNIKLFAKNNIIVEGERFVLDNSFQNIFKYRELAHFDDFTNKFSNITKILAYEPTFTTGVSYIYDKNGLKVTPGIKLSYNPVVNVLPEATKPEFVNHNVKIAPSLEAKYEMKDQFTLEATAKGSFTQDYRGTKINEEKNATNINGKIELKGEYTGLKELELKASLSDEIKSQLYKNTAYLSSLTNKLVFDVTSKYTYSLTKTDKLVFENGLNIDSYLNNSYVLNQGTIDSKPKNELNVLESVHKLKSNNKVSYVKTIDKVEITTGVKANIGMDLLEVDAQKIIKLSLSDKDVLEQRERIVENKTYVGFKIDLEPSVDVKYTIIDGLELTGSASVNTSFAKNVINKINNEDSSDNGRYSTVDKTFGFRQITPKLGIKLEYKW